MRIAPRGILWRRGVGGESGTGIRFRKSCGKAKADLTNESVCGIVKTNFRDAKTERRRRVFSGDRSPPALSAALHRAETHLFLPRMPENCGNSVLSGQKKRASCVQKQARLRHGSVDACDGGHRFAREVQKNRTTHPAANFNSEQTRKELIPL